MRMVPFSLSSNEYHTTAPQNAVMVNSRISPFHAGANHYSKEGDNCREDPKLFTEEAADENGWLAVILWIIRHHCVTKIIGFDVSYGYMCSYGYSATTAIFDKRRINKFIV